MKLCCLNALEEHWNQLNFYQPVPGKRLCCNAAAQCKLQKQFLEIMHTKFIPLLEKRARRGKKDLKKPHICYTGTIIMVHKKAVEGIYSNSLGCSIRVIVQSGFAPSVNSLWNLKKERE